MLGLIKIARGGLFYPIDIAEMPGYHSEINVLLSEDEQTSLINHLALNPECGVVMPGTGGLRKLRWGGQGKGKSTGLRIIYLYHDLNMPLILLAVYTKGERLQLTKRQEKEMSKLADALRLEYAQKRNRICEVGSSA